MRIRGPATCPVILLLLMIGSCNGKVGDSSEVDSGTDEPDGPVDCVPFAEMQCVNGDVYWLDSCGEVSELADACTTETPCIAEEAACCRPAITGETNPFPIPGQITWTYGAGGNSLAIEIEVLSTTPIVPRQKFGPRLFVDSIGVNLFLTTDLHVTGGRGVSIDFDIPPPGDATTEAGPGAEIVSINSETLHKVNLPYDWTGKTLRLRLVREADGWVRGYLDEGGTTMYIGGHQFGDNTMPSSFRLVNVVEGLTTYEATPLLDLAFSAPTFDGTAPLAGVLAYNSPEFDNMDVRFDDSQSPPGRWRFGGSTPRCQDPGAVYP